MLSRSALRVCRQRAGGVGASAAAARQSSSAARVQESLQKLRSAAGAAEEGAATYVSPVVGAAEGSAAAAAGQRPFHWHRDLKTTWEMLLFHITKAKNPHMRIWLTTGVLASGIFFWAYTQPGADYWKQSPYGSELLKRGFKPPYAYESPEAAKQWEEEQEAMKAAAKDDHHH